MRRYSRPAPVLLGCLLLAAPACGKKADVPEVATPAPPVKSLGPPVTEAEARQFAEQLAQAIKAGDAARANQLLHIPNLLDRLVSDFGLSPRDRENFVRGAQVAMGQDGFAQSLQKVVSEGGSYKLLRVRTLGGQPRALFRMVNAEGALNYHDYLLARFPDGVGMEDVYVYLMGEPLSQTLRRLLLPLAARGGQGVFGGGVDPEYVRGVAKFGELTQAVKAGQLDRATALYRGLPKKLQDDKGVLVAYMQALMPQLDAANKEYLEVLEKFRTLYPDDPAGDFMAIDYHFLKKQFDQAVAAVNRLETAVGGDPYLDVLRANALAEAKRFDQARAAAERAVKAEPTLPLAYGARLIVSLRERKYADTLEWLKKMVQNCGVTMDDLAANPEYAEFVRSPQYQQWLAWYRDRGGKK